MVLSKTIFSSSKEAFEVLVVPYQDLNGLECVHEEHDIDLKRIVFDGKAEFVSEQLAIQIVESDNSHILKKLEIPKQDASYMTDLEEPTPEFKNYITGDFDQKTARDSFATIVDKLYNTKFVMVYLKRKALS
jgi:hypothetical protein